MNLTPLTRMRSFELFIKILHDTIRRELDDDSDIWVKTCDRFPHSSNF